MAHPGTASSQSASPNRDAPERAPAPAAGVVLGGLHGSSGKTVLTCLLLAALEARGLAVQPFKAGPDYIDPGFHNHYSKRPSRNLDPWLMGASAVWQEAAQHTREATGVLEGVLGLFDGASPTSEEGSTMALARELDWPILLSVPAAKAGRSLAASLRGFLLEAHPHRIAGVVLNGVTGDSHTAYLKEALQPLGVPILGAIPRLHALEWPERHLGLRAAAEQTLPAPGALAELAHRLLDLEAITALCRTHPLAAPTAAPASTTHPTPRQTTARKRIALAQDEAFHFYYAANLEWLAAQDAQLLPFSPLHSPELPPETDAILLGGGFPEVFAEQLAQNTSLLRSLHSAAHDQVPIYAECGGLMLLAEEIVTLEGRRFPMANIVPGAVEMTRSLQHFGYCSAHFTTDAPAHALRGHEFHHARWTREHDLANRWQVTRRRTGKTRTEGYGYRSVHASFVHLHFPAHAAPLRSLLHLHP